MGRLVFLEGVIGVGKTSILDALRRRGHNVVEEDVNGWVLWDNRCLDPARYTFSFQVEVCLSIHKCIQNAIIECEGLVFCERSVKSSVVFAQVSKDLYGHVCDKEIDVLLQLCSRLSDTITGHCRGPAMTVYLWCPIQVALCRIEGRGRSGERSIEGDYLTALDSGFRKTCKFDIDLCTDGVTPDEVAVQLLNAVCN